MANIFDTLSDARDKLNEVHKEIQKAQSEARQQMSEARVAASIAQKMLSKITDDEVRQSIESQVTVIIEALGRING